MEAQVECQSFTEPMADLELFEEIPELFRKSEFTDITLVVEGKELNFAKYPLMVGSTLLASMIKGSENQSRLVLDDVSYKDMLIFLECLHPLKFQAISDLNLEAVAVLAHRFRHEGILHRCEEYIIDKFNNASGPSDVMYPNFFSHLNVAEKYEMKKAVQVGVSSERVVKAYFGPKGYGRAGYKDNVSFIQLSTDTKSQILSRRLLSAEEEIETLEYNIKTLEENNKRLENKIQTLANENHQLKWNSRK